MASMNTRLNIKKLDENIVQKHEGSKQDGLKQLGFKQVGFKQLGHKQVGFKQLGPGVETGFHGVQDEKRVWFKVELQGAQGDREVEVFKVSNDDTPVAQRRTFASPSGAQSQSLRHHTPCLDVLSPILKSLVNQRTRRQREKAIEQSFRQSQPQPRFKEPQPPAIDNRIRKRMVKRATVDLAEDDEKEEEQTRQCACWSREEEILLTGLWIETSENGQIGADRSDDSFWGQILQDFNNATIQGHRTKNMLTGKWTMINDDCQKSNAIYKHLERKSEENEADPIEAAKINFAAQQPKGRKFMLEHMWCILNAHTKWTHRNPLKRMITSKFLGLMRDLAPLAKLDPQKRPNLKRPGAAVEVHRGLYLILRS
nr:glutathione S-transferase T3-like isoform X1 [Tanacetum cinerariifolium]